MSTVCRLVTNPLLSISTCFALASSTFHLTSNNTACARTTHVTFKKYKIRLTGQSAFFATVNVALSSSFALRLHKLGINCKKYRFQGRRSYPSNRGKTGKRASFNLYPRGGGTHAQVLHERQIYEGFVAPWVHISIRGIQVMQWNSSANSKREI